MWISSRRLFALLALVAALALSCSSNEADARDDESDPGSATSELNETQNGESQTDETDPDPDPDPDETETDPEVEPVVRDFAAVDDLVASNVADLGLNGAGLLIVEQDEGIVYENYWGEIGPDRVSFLASASKVLSAGVLFNLADQGLLDLDAPISEQTGWLPDNNGITTAQLLSNSSGLVGLGPDPTYGPYICQFLAFGTTEDCGRGIYLTPADDADVIEPDTEFRYGGGQWQVAGGVAEAVSGKTWPELINEIYVEPCGLDTLGYSNHFALFDDGYAYPQAFDRNVSALPTDNPNIEGGAYALPRDYAELVLMHLRDGRCGETQVLSPESVERMKSGRVEATPGPEGERDYGYGWWVGDEIVYDPGAYGAVAWIDDSGRYGGYLIIENNGPTVQQLQRDLFDAVNTIMEE